MKNQTEMVVNQPNAAKLMMSLRHLDYNNSTAMADLIDNSIDAESSEIRIFLESNSAKKLEKIVIIDNGIGMNEQQLIESLKLGSESEKNVSFDLGCYGMGLVTASISIGRKVEVLSQSDEKDDVIKATLDLDVIENENKFLINVNKLSTNSLLESINEHCFNEIKTGTKIVISKLDRLDYIQISAFRDSLKKHLGQTFRKFISSQKCKIYIDNIEIKAIDPIRDFEPKLINEDSITVDDEKVDIKIFMLKDYGRIINNDKKINIRNQGFYVFRNEREILSGETFGIFTKHNSLNLLRIELSFPAKLDEILKSNFTKQKISLDQKVKDKISNFCEPFIRQVKKLSQVKHAEENLAKGDFKNVEKFITKKSHLLKTPKVTKEKRKISKAKIEPKESKNQKESSPRLNITKRQKVDIDSLKIEFKTMPMGEKGPLYEPEMEGDKVIIKWNQNHSFYHDVVLENVDNPDIFNPIAFLVYSLSTAELMASDNSDTLEIIENIRYWSGMNLATLLKS